jgi:uncharacterized protein YhaN
LPSASPPLNTDRKRLPVDLTEVFVNGDKPSHYATFEILQDMAQKRELFVFTCPFFTEETAEHLGA